MVGVTSMTIMMNIAVFVKNLTSGGAEKQSVLLAKALSDTYNIHYIIFNGEKVHLKYMDMLKDDDRISIIAFRGGRIKRYMALTKYINKNHIQLIFSYLTAANLYACMAGLQTGAKVFTGLRNAELPFAKCLVDKYLTNRFAKMTIANCFSGKLNFTSKGFIADKIVVIPNCFENINSNVKKLDNKDGIRIITVGRFVPQKDYETAIRAIAELRKVCDNINFDIIGYGDLENVIKAWIKQYELNDIVNLYINPNNIPELLNNADIYLSTSLFEGTSNSIMEGMNANLPIVATNVGDNAYLVEDGINGYLVEVKDFIALSKCLVKLSQNANDRKRMGKNSKIKLLESYSMSIFKERYISMIEKYC